MNFITLSYFDLYIVINTQNASAYKMHTYVYMYIFLFSKLTKEKYIYSFMLLPFLKLKVVSIVDSSLYL